MLYLILNRIIRAHDPCNRKYTYSYLPCMKMLYGFDTYFHYLLYLFPASPCKLHNEYDMDFLSS